MYNPPPAVKKEASLSLELKKLGFEGGTATGFARARSLVRGSIDLENLLIMRNWFARHLHTSRPGYVKWHSLRRPKGDQYKKKSRGAVAWLLWGGDPAYLWVSSLTPILTKKFGKDYSLPRI